MIKTLWLLFLFCTLSAMGAPYNLLDDSAIYIDTQNSSFETVLNKPFQKIQKTHINYGFNADISVWIRFELSNENNITTTSVLEINNPLLEHVVLYEEKAMPRYSGMLHVNAQQEQINPAFTIRLEPHSTRTYYLHVSNTTTALQFSLALVTTDHFKSSDKRKQFFIISFIGIIGAFLIYALALFIYTKAVSYLFYSFYIATLVFQQLTYIGFLPLYMPPEFTAIDNLLVVPKVAIMIIAAALFARSFLKTQNFETLDRIYKYFIYALIFQILFFATPWFYYPEITILTGLLFIFFNLYAGIYVYRKGNKQARFFIAGWSILIVGYFLSIIDALGLYSVMYHLPILVLICTIFEALFLLLAFVDQLNILQSQKALADMKLYKELELRNSIVNKEVEERTQALKSLYRELHHRVKNNLQIILSIIRLQGDRLDNESLKSPFLHLENRIRSIAKTHELLYQNEDTDTIDMHEYLESLCEDIQASLCKKNLKFSLDINADMALREAVYVGLIINELVSNSIKHAPACNQISIALHKEDAHAFSLHVSDNGTGYNDTAITQTSLGLKLVSTLVNDQLGGTMHRHDAVYEIRFSI